MSRLIVTFLTIITGFFALVASLIMVIPLTIAALITGRRIRKEMQNYQFATEQNAVIEGEYEEVAKK